MMQHVYTNFFPDFREIFYSFPNPYLEGLLSKCILYSKTTICESYIHWLGIMVPKWQNVTKGEYSLREAAAYIAFCKRQDDKSLFTKKLRQHKYASTLIGTAGQKNGRYERYVVEAIMNTVSSDPSTINAGKHLQNKVNERIQKRQQRLNLLNNSFQCDVTAQNLKMGPVKHEYRTAGSDGVLSGKQYQESSTSAKPVPPFPFLKEDLLTSDEEKQRLNNIWDWAKSLKSERIEHATLNCDICNEVIADSELLLRCSSCSTPAHESCIGTHTTGWTEQEKKIFCGQCNVIRLVLMTPVFYIFLILFLYLSQKKWPYDAKNRQK